MPELDLADACARFQTALLAEIRAGLRGRTSDELMAVTRQEPDDSVFRIDEIAESRISELLAREFQGLGLFRIVMEGQGEELVLDLGGRERFVLLIDPVDGSRVLAWDKRSAHILTAIAPDLDGAETLADILVAAQTEIPTSRSELSDQLVARRGAGLIGRRLQLRDGTSLPFRPKTTAAGELAGGFGNLVRFFAPGRELLARIDDLLIEELYGPGDRPPVFEDQYLSTGGLVHQLATGRDRFVADLRPRLARKLEAEGKRGPLCSHPYDLASLLVAEEAGALITSEHGGPLSAPLDRLERCGFIAYANASIREQVEEPLLRIAAEVLGDGRN